MVVAKSGFVKVFGDTAINRLWEFLIDSRGLFDYSKTDICEASKISWNTLKEIFPLFEKENIVLKTRKIGRATMYKLNEQHPSVVFMIGLYKTINMLFVHGGKFKMKMEMSIIKDHKKSIPIVVNVDQPTIETICKSEASPVPSLT